MKTEKPKDPNEALLVAIAKANSHPDPKAYAAEVLQHLKDGDDV